MNFFANYITKFLIFLCLHCLIAVLIHYSSVIPYVFTSR